MQTVWTPIPQHQTLHFTDTTLSDPATCQGTHSSSVPVILKGAISPIHPAHLEGSWLPAAKEI